MIGQPEPDDEQERTPDGVRQVPIFEIFRGGRSSATKRCPNCPPGVVKPASDFNRSRHSADGLQHWCRECQRLWSQIKKEELLASQNRKQCTGSQGCGQWKPLSEFHKYGNPPKISSSCKVCKAKYNRKRRAEKSGLTTEQTSSRSRGGQDSPITYPDTGLTVKWCSSHGSYHPIGEFPRDRTRPSGYHSSCKAAKKLHGKGVFKRSRQAKPVDVPSESRLPVIPDGAQKFCPTCKEFHPLTDFQRNQTKANGIQSECRDCANKRRNVNRRKLKPSQAEPERIQVSEVAVTEIPTPPGLLSRLRFLFTGRAK